MTPEQAERLIRTLEDINVSIKELSSAIKGAMTPCAAEEAATKTANQILSALEEAFNNPSLEADIEIRRKAYEGPITQQIIQDVEECQIQIHPDPESTTNDLEK